MPASAERPGRTVLLRLPSSLPDEARPAVQHLTRALTDRDAVTVVLLLDDVQEPDEQQAAIVQGWCLDGHPDPARLPEIHLLGRSELDAVDPDAVRLSAADADPGDLQDAVHALLGRRADADAPRAGSRLLVVLVADQTPAAVAHSLRAHVTAVVAADRPTGFVLVQQHPSAEVADLLALVDGAEVVRPGGYLGIGRSWEQAWDAAPSDCVLLSTATSVPDPEAVRTLVEALDADPAAVAVAPGSSSPAALLVRTEALHELRARHRRAVQGSRQAVLALTRLTRRLADLGRVVVAPARFEGLPLRQDPSVAVAGWVPATLQLAHPGAATVGPWTYFTGNGARLVTYESYERIEIGSYCSIADDVRLVNPGRPDDHVTLREGRRGPVLRRDAHRPGTATTFPVGNRFPGLDDFVDSGAAVPGSGSVLSVGHDVWIGFGATVLGAVRVGHGAVIGAGAMVTKDVAPYSVVVGNPGRVVRTRVPHELVEPLLEIAWWDWPEADVLDRAAWFTRPVEQFVAEFGAGTASLRA